MEIYPRDDAIDIRFSVCVVMYTWRSKNVLPFYQAYTTNNVYCLFQIAHHLLLTREI